MPPKAYAAALEARATADELQGSSPACQKQAGYASGDRHGCADETPIRRLGRSEAKVERDRGFTPETHIPRLLLTSQIHSVVPSGYHQVPYCSVWAVPNLTGTKAASSLLHERVQNNRI